MQEENVESTRAKQHKCDVCSKSFYYPSRLKTHMLVHCNDRPHICCVCEKGFKSKQALEIHMLKHSNDKSIHGTTIKTPSSQTNHPDRHKVELYPCSQCKKLYKFKRGLRQHIREVHEVVGSIECNDCGNCFRGIHNFKNHLKRHLRQFGHFVGIYVSEEKGGVEIKYDCKVCNHTFTSISQLKTHMNSHSNIVTFKCDECTQIFFSKDTLNKHVKAHNRERFIECNICGEKFTSDHFLRVHRQGHRRENGYMCEVCQKQFSCNSQLIKHKRIHEGEKPFKCDDCGKCFTQKGHLTVHFRVHTGEKPYLCNLCNIRFTTTSSYKKHMSRHGGNAHLNVSIPGKVEESSSVRTDPPEPVQVFIEEEESNFDGEEVEEDRNPLEDLFTECKRFREEEEGANESAMKTDDVHDFLEDNSKEHLKDGEKFLSKKAVEVFVKTEETDMFEDEVLENCDAEVIHNCTVKLEEVG